MHLSSVYTHIPVNPPYSVGYIPLVNHSQCPSCGALHEVYYSNCGAFMGVSGERAYCVSTHIWAHTCQRVCVCVYVPVFVYSYVFRIRTRFKTLLA